MADMSENPYQAPREVNKPDAPAILVFQETRLPPSSGPLERAFRRGIVIVVILLIALFTVV